MIFITSYTGWMWIACYYFIQVIWEKYEKQIIEWDILLIIIIIDFILFYIFIMTNNYLFQLQLQIIGRRL